MSNNDEVNARILRCINSTLAGLHELDGPSKLTAVTMAYARIVVEEREIKNPREFQSEMVLCMISFLKLLEEPREFFDAVLDTKENKTHLI